jgi:hypothetical protein
LQAVESEAGLFGVDAIGEERVDYVADGDLDSFDVFERRNLQRLLLARMTEMALGALAKRAMEVAVVVVFQRRRIAQLAVGFDVVAGWSRIALRHGISLALSLTLPREGVVCFQRFKWCNLRKILIRCGLQAEY